MRTKQEIEELIEAYERYYNEACILFEEAEDEDEELRMAIRKGAFLLRIKDLKWVLGIL